MKTNIITHTDGKGYWSRRVAEIRIVEIFLDYYDDEEDKKFGELCARFHEEDWKEDKDGLIYTDKQWEKEFRAALIGLGLSESVVKSVGYSEQGMQGDDYVSLDVGHDFFDESQNPIVQQLLADYNSTERD